MHPIGTVEHWQECDAIMQEKLRVPKVRRAPVTAGECLMAKIYKALGWEPDEPPLDDYANHLFVGAVNGALKAQIPDIHTLVERDWEAVVARAPQNSSALSTQRHRREIAKTLLEVLAGKVVYTEKRENIVATLEGMLA